jgi:hypothetical protein
MTVRATRALFEKAQQELGAHFPVRFEQNRKQTEAMVYDSVYKSYEFAQRHHAQHKPELRRNPLLDNPAVPESTKQILRDGDERINKMMVENHRLGLIKLFTIDGKISQATAEEIVDTDILGK